LVADVVAEHDQSRTLVAVPWGAVEDPVHGRSVSEYTTADALRIAADALPLQVQALTRTSEALLALADQEQPPVVAPRLLSINQAAASLGVGRRKVHHLIEAGEIPGEPGSARGEH
jgi:hypothetical protein